jgi:hypothetical protein
MPSNVHARLCALLACALLLATPMTGTPLETAATIVERPIDAEVFDLAFSAAACAIRAGAAQAPATLTVIDYSKASTEKRLWVFDMHSRELLYEELVAHGQGTGEDFATVFSNEPDTHQSSLGLFLTDETYVGRNGYSLRLDGLDRGFNDRARERAIVMHGAPYVSEAFAEAQGRLGRSWGCPALRQSVAREVIDRVKGGGLLFAYYPDAKWLTSSKYLGDCAAASTDYSRVAAN